MKILLINNTYNSPSVGGIRSRMLAKALASRGHHVHVLTSTVESASEAVDGLVEEKIPALSFEAILQLIKPNYEGENAPVRQTTGAAGAISQGGKWKNWLNRWCMIPDKFLPWINPAVRAGTRILIDEDFDVVYATTPVRSNLLVGSKLSRKNKLPLVVEYRDLWTDNPYAHNASPTPIHKWFHRQLENSVFRQAKKITSVCRGIQEVLKDKGQVVHQEDVSLNYNFYDPSCFDEFQKIAHGATFRIVYVGALYGSRQPYVFFEGMKKFLKQSGLSSAKFRFDCIGRSHGIGDVEATIERLGLTDYIHFVGQVPHVEAVEHLCNADTALIVQAPEDESHIPAKLYETLGARTPALLVCPECETSKILEECSAGVVCEHTAESVAAGLEKLYDQWKTKEPWSFNQKAIEEYSLDKAVVRFEELLQSAIDIH